MRSRRRTSHSAAAATSIQTGGHSELLEQRQLLSVTNSARQIVASEDVIGTGHTLQIEEVYIVDNELWVLSRLTSIRLAGNDSINDLPEDVIHLQDEVNLVVPDLEVRHFRIGGFGYENPTVARIFPTEVGSVTTFHQRLENQTSEQLYSRIDPALSEWRDNVFNALQQQADKQYADSFGMEAPERPIWILPVAELPELWQSEAMFQNFALTGSVSEATAALSDTNVQVDGIDEADIVETDGDYIYTISDRNELVVLKAARDGEAASVVSRTDLAVRPTAIFLYEGRLTVISTTLFSKSGIRAATINNLQHRTTVTILDVSTPESPSLIQESVVDGRFQDARAIGSQVYVVIGNNSNIPYLPSLNHVTDTDFSTGRRFETRSEYLHRLHLLVHGTGEGDGELAPPSVYQRTVESDGTENLKRLGWLNGNDELITPVSGQLTSVIRFDSNSSNPGPVDNIGVYHRRHSDSTIYASMNAIYLVAAEYDQIENNGLFIVPHSNQPSSRIHKIDISSDKMVVGAIGSVPGIVESQFSLDEHNGYLRIATTTGNVWNNTSFNNMFVLQDVGDDLVEVGSVRDLAQGERIYSVRFDGDRAWMVTFRQVDPVYSFDLSDPGNPNVTGELKITGYSEYLQLIDENLLLAIGRDASETGQLEGVQVSLFDISDMTTPTLIDRYSFDGELWSYSSALLDHHAFHYLPDFNLLAIPYFESGPTSLPSGQSLAFLDIDPMNGISLRGELPTQTAVNVQRSVQIDDLLYAISGSNVRIVNLSDVEAVLADISLADDATPIERREDLAQAVDNILNIRRYVDEESGEALRIELREVLGSILPNGAEDVEYEFRALDVDGVERLRALSWEPILTLAEDTANALAAGTYNFQMRTRSRVLQNADWTNWTPGTTATILSDRTDMLSAPVLKSSDRMLRWSTVADRVTAIAQSAGETNYEQNPVSHFELWLSDAAKRETIFWRRDIPTAEFDTSDLAPATYWAWFRPVFKDGSLGDWSRRHQFDILGDKLNLLTTFQHTANKRPVFIWDKVSSTSFEVEVMSADGFTTVYSADDLIAARLEFSEDLPAGSYTFRVRAAFASGGFSEWTDPYAFTIVDRPRLSIVNDTIQWEDNGAERHELWVSRLGSTEPLVHQTDLHITQINSALTNLGLEQAGRFSVWVRSFLPDGSKTAWSPRATLQRFAEAIKVKSIADVIPGQTASIHWEAAESVESYEIYVQRAGQSGAVYRLPGITELNHTIPQQLTRGRYLTWVRGALAGGGFTKWGQAHAFNVADQLHVTFANNVLSWVSTNTNSDVQYEVWVNRVDDNLSLLTSRVMHLLDVVGQTVSLDQLPDGKYTAWVRELKTVNGEIVRSPWSERSNFEVSPISDLTDAFEEGINDLLDLLNQI